jgi:hypothetical protein
MFDCFSYITNRRVENRNQIKTKIRNEIKIVGGRPDPTGTDNRNAQSVWGAASLPLSLTANGWRRAPVDSYPPAYRPLQVEIPKSNCHQKDNIFCDGLSYIADSGFHGAFRYAFAPTTK